MKRGDLVTIAVQGAYGKPRPAVIIQSDLFSVHPSVTVLPVTGELRNAPLFRVPMSPTKKNGLTQPSEVMVDKAQSVPREKIGARIGRASEEDMLVISRSLAVFLGVV